MRGSNRQRQSARHVPVVNVKKKRSASDECNSLGVLPLLLHDEGGDEGEQAVDLLGGADGALGL